MTSTETPENQNILWQPTTEQAHQTALYRFWKSVEQQRNMQFDDYRQLHRWSVEHKEDFWVDLWEFAGIVGDMGEDTFVPGERFQDCQWFGQARLNWAENLLSYHAGHEQDTALIEISEDGERRSLSWGELHQHAAAMAWALKNAGVAPGDRVAGWLPNRSETLIAALGCAWIGAVWSSCSPDFGIQGVLDRFSQIQPKILIVCDSYLYNGKSHDLREKASQIQTALKPLITIAIKGPANNPVNDSVDWQTWLTTDGTVPAYERQAFNHPLFILYSSGTTGAPKCIVHGTGGTLLQHAKEHRLHGNLQEKDRLFYFTTCGWMMWNWLAGGLQSGATLVLYDGNPGFPDLGRLMDLVDQEQISHFGTSAKFIQAMEKAAIYPNQSHSLTSLRCLFSTGSTLLHESYDYLYQHVKADMQVSSISGGTDILSCFALGNPLLPVIRGELQCPGLGMDVVVLNDAGSPVTGEKGELGCRTPFPSMPIYFWNDEDGSRYHDAYFANIEGLWAHGDYAEICPHPGHDGIIIHGRSDAVLNPGGVRIGTAEIYRQVETLPEIRESLVIGQDWEGDIRVVLFVVLRDAQTLTDELKQRICHAIRTGASPRHVPAKIIQAPEIPRTVSGKIVELAVRNQVNGLPVKNQNALANPDALAFFAEITELNAP